ncbi:hypothetical protein BDA99DRAFT_491661 [Phascolomyces articulosus]|uniref:Transcription factor domain-containing protein n=1 Tax=Phascolomyces articulosus TaxID=60185 RepID=A0AAD5KQL5_9FUNG|nr:hypothetical protein BDA99DRAFT_491661 [Phascolomyces articulosus]
MQCERCCRMELPCVFKFTAKPNIVKKFVPMSKRNRMLDQVQLLEEEVAAMEMQLRSLQVAAQLQRQPVQFVSSSKSTKSSRDEQGRTEKKRQRRDSWQLTLARDNTSNGGLQLQTSIKSVADVATFLKNTIGYFTPYRSPNYFVDRKSQYLVVTNKMLHMEQFFRIIFAKQMDHQQQEQQNNNTMLLDFPRLYHNNNNNGHSIHDTNAIKLQFLDTYFNCNGYTIPLLVRPYYHAYLRSRPNSMLTSAIAAYVGYAQCQHVPLACQSYRKEMAEIFRQEARKLVEDAMFEQEPNVELVGTLLMLGQTYLILLRNSEGRIFISMAWRIAMQLRDKYLAVLHDHEHQQQQQQEKEKQKGQQKSTSSETKTKKGESQCQYHQPQQQHNYLHFHSHNSPPTQQAYSLPLSPPLQPIILTQDQNQEIGPLAEAESWRRMFYMVRYLEINMHIIYDGRDNVSPTLLHDDIGYPTVLPCESMDPSLNEAVHLYHHIVRINDCHISTRVDETGYRLMLGSMEQVPSSDIEYLENQMFGFWRSLPHNYQLSDTPMEYITMERTHQCQNPNVLYLNMLYYCYWLALETRLMQPPSRTDLVGASMNRVDGERALVIVSICCDALAKIFQELSYRLPCVLELHWVLIACDAMKELRASPNNHIRSRAEENMRTTLRILKHFVLTMNNDMDPFTSTSSSGTLPPPPSSSQQQPLSREERGPTPFSISSSGSTVGTSDDECDIISPSTSSSTIDQSAVPPSKGTAAYFFELKRTLESYFEPHDYLL